MGSFTESVKEIEETNHGFFKGVPLLKPTKGFIDSLNHSLYPEIGGSYRMDNKNRFRGKNMYKAQCTMNKQCSPKTMTRRKTGKMYNKLRKLFKKSVQVTYPKNTSIEERICIYRVEFVKWICKNYLHRVDVDSWFLKA